MSNAKKFFREATGQTIKITGYEFPSEAEWQAIVDRIMAGTATQADIATYQTIRWWQGDNGN